MRRRSAQTTRTVPGPDRRTVLRGGLGLGALAVSSGALGGLTLVGCGDDSSGTTAAGDAATPDHTLLASFPQGDPYIAAGTPTRMPFLITDAEGIPMSDIEGPVTFTVVKDGDQVGDPVAVDPRSEGIPRAYLPLTFTFPDPAIYDVTAEYGGESLLATVQVFTADQVAPPVVGEAMPSVATPTPTSTLEVDPICTRVPACPFHATSLTDALAAGSPTVVMVSTPAYCQTAICGPVLDLLMSEAPNHPDLTVIHAEVYMSPADATNLSTAPLAPLPDELGLTFEPTMFVLDGSGVVVARADIVVDRTEMQELLALV